MYSIKKLVLLIFAAMLICTAFLNTGCVNSNAVPIELVNASGNANYRIVRPQKLNFDALSDVRDFERNLEDIVGANFNLVTDNESYGESADEVANICEILIGATTRPESVEARKELTENDYVIRVMGNKIVITGSSELTTKKAMSDFLDLVSNESGTRLMSNTDILVNIERGPYLVALTNQNKGYVEVYDVTGGIVDESSLVWSYKIKDVTGVKLRHSKIHGDVMLATGGSGYACMVSYPEGRLIWSTSATGNNPHSIEFLPNGIVAVASSDGNQVRFFKTDNEESESADAVMPLNQAHGVLWDEKLEVVWAIGNNVLTAYRVAINSDGGLTVTEDTNLPTTIPSNGSHDLAPVYGSENELWITTFNCVYRFNTKTMSFSTDYEEYDNISHANLKGIGNFDDGTTVYIYPDAAYAQWTSKSIYLVKPNSKAVDQITSETNHFYKVRVWDSRYH